MREPLDRAIPVAIPVAFRVAIRVAIRVTFRVTIRRWSCGRSAGRPGPAPTPRCSPAPPVPPPRPRPPTRPGHPRHLDRPAGFRPRARRREVRPGRAVALTRMLARLEDSDAAVHLDSDGRPASSRNTAGLRYGCGTYWHGALRDSARSNLGESASRAARTASCGRGPARGGARRGAAQGGEGGRGGGWRAAGWVVQGGRGAGCGSGLLPSEHEHSRAARARGCRA